MPLIQDYCNRLAEILNADRNMDQNIKQAATLIERFFGLVANDEKIKKAAVKIQHFIRFLRQKRKIKGLLKYYLIYC